MKVGGWGANKNGGGRKGGGQTEMEVGGGGHFLFWFGFKVSFKETYDIK